EGKRLSQNLRGGGWVSLLQKVASFSDQLVEAVDVRGETEAITAGTRLDRVGPQRLAKLGDVDLDALARRGRGSAGPELVGQQVGSYDLVAVQGEQGEECALLRRPEVERPPVLTGLERPEDANFHTRERIDRIAKLAGKLGPLYRSLGRVEPRLAAASRGGALCSADPTEGPERCSRPTECWAKSTKPTSRGRPTGFASPTHLGSDAAARCGPRFPRWRSRSRSFSSGCLPRGPKPPRARGRSRRSGRRRAPSSAS